MLLFDDKDVAKSIDNIVAEVKGCLVHLHVSLNDLLPFPSDHQILIKSQNLPISWERAIIVRKFFENFGIVTGMMRKKEMLVISFKQAIAAKLTGRLLQVELVPRKMSKKKTVTRTLVLQVPWDPSAVFVREVSCLTIANNTSKMFNIPTTTTKNMGPSVLKLSGI